LTAHSAAWPVFYWREAFRDEDPVSRFNQQFLANPQFSIVNPQFQSAIRNFNRQSTI
jgi:hypothetical protein